MAFPAFSLKLPHIPLLSRNAQSNPFLQFKLPAARNSSVIFHSKLVTTKAKVRGGELSLRRAVEESQENTESEAAIETQSSSESSGEVSELGAEIKKAMMERKEEKEGDLWSGVAEEVQEIEWPAFGKVLGTTGVVLGVIAGSSVVLLTVNAVLAELSDRIFAGSGVQDFFS